MLLSIEVPVKLYFIVAFVVLGLRQLILILPVGEVILPLSVT
jgi:hypothetical protein